MSAPAASLEDLLARIDRLERKLDAALKPRRELLSKRAAAKLLGIDRGSTLERLIRDGRVRLVAGKIPANELDRLLTNGLPDQKSPRRRKEQPSDEAAAIRALQV